MEQTKATSTIVGRIAPPLRARDLASLAPATRLDFEISPKRFV